MQVPPQGTWSPGKMKVNRWTVSSIDKITEKKQLVLLFTAPRGNGGNPWS